ncbi:Carbon-nitrogen hydrolase [Pseudocohnilembus persalinus]|uniref:Carbon-nitrogen hydrolase n=1 Tax=Pseudocohnilembus persalinus TaxID=266149 RepID=A0A0V0R6W4_PSEPJ|nr:Carbon-nitrogen hydrolase [Pseudocohnilembus persalinus]|eukprot:KRX10203.1 Carbon-nitrogen hydrolase [Pseudocohnilembus persalinus]
MMKIAKQLNLIKKSADLLLKQTPKFQFCAENSSNSDDVWDNSLAHSSKPELKSVEAALNKYLPPEELAEVKRILYGNPVSNLEFSSQAKSLAEELNMELKGYKIDCPKEQLRKPRIVRVGAIQNRIKRPPSDSIQEQTQSLRDWMAKAVKVAHEAGVNVLCTQELWCGPFFPATRETQPWYELAEDIENGPTAKLFKELAAAYNMVIINSQLERDQHGSIHNTVAVFSNRGEYIGKHRKNHIPRVGDFNESTYYMEGNTGHPVFDTAFGKIGINICYGRHFPQNWMMFGLNGAEIVFNPSATIGALSEPLWPEIQWSVKVKQL